jgi:hypothetical protein
MELQVSSGLGAQMPPEGILRQIAQVHRPGATRSGWAEREQDTLRASASRRSIPWFRGLGSSNQKQVRRLVLAGGPKRGNGDENPIEGGRITRGLRVRSPLREHLDAYGACAGPP